MVASAMLDKSTFIELYQAKARANLAEAQVCLEMQQPRAAISRAYYALYQAASAWLAHTGGDEAFDPARPNGSHDEVEARWREILRELPALGIVPDAEGETLYPILNSLRVRVDYKPRWDPNLNDACHAVAAADRAVPWLISALERAGR